MATSEQTIERILNSVQGANIRIAKMFGEYALYCDEKVVALICDDQMFVKPTASSTAELDATHESPPYPGAKPYLRIPEELVSDSNWLTRLINGIAKDLPAPKPKAPRKAKRTG